MKVERRRCKLSNSEYKDVDLRKYEDVIIETINNTVPGKNPKVCRRYFYTDVLTQSEAVSLGRALARIDTLKEMGKAVTIFRLFDGQICNHEEVDDKTNKNEKQINIKPKGGRMT